MPGTIQLQIFNPTSSAATLKLKLTPEEQFQKYHQENPQVYDAFCRIAQGLWSSGHRHYGAKAIMEYIRMETAVRGNDGIKINNNYTRWYARLLIQQCPDFRDFFRLRELKT